MKPAAVVTIPKGGGSQEKRKRILAGAYTVFVAEGFSGASMDSVAMLAGVSKMTLYRYFGSKEQLFAGMITDMCARLMDTDLPEKMNSCPPRKALEVFGRRMLKIIFAPETLGLHRLVTAECRRFPEFGRLLYKSGPEAAVRMLTAYLRAHRKDPALKAGNPREAAQDFMTLLRGYEHMQALLSGNGTSSFYAEKNLERAIRCVLR